MQELIILRRSIEPDGCTADTQYPLVFSVIQAARKGLFGSRAMEIPDKKLKSLTSQAPNITLNVRGSTSTATELWFCVAIGVVLQTAAIVVPGLTVYLWNWQKEGTDVAAYGYPSFLVGSLSVILGIIGCSRVIEARTEETEFHVDSDFQ